MEMYRKVKCTDRLPTKNNTYFTGWNDMHNGIEYAVALGSNYWNGKEFEFDDDDEQDRYTHPDWWLEEVEQFAKCEYYESDATTAMNCKNCGKSKGMH